MYDEQVYFFFLNDEEENFIRKEEREKRIQRKKEKRMIRNQPLNKQYLQLLNYKLKANTAKDSSSFGQPATSK